MRRIGWERERKDILMALFVVVRFVSFKLVEVLSD